MGILEIGRNFIDHCILEGPKQMTDQMRDLKSGFFGQITPGNFAEGQISGVSGGKFEKKLKKSANFWNPGVGWTQNFHFFFSVHEIIAKNQVYGGKFFKKSQKKPLFFHFFFSRG